MVFLLAGRNDIFCQRVFPDARCAEFLEYSLQVFLAVLLEAAADAVIDVMSVALDQFYQMLDIIVSMGFNGFHEIYHDYCHSFRLDSQSLRYATSS